ncbi:hypothetical protein DC498_09270 [Terrimonas sp.]|uniref:hypothetical protein n=1 Tax=Terrimonas sp. TaxID=1914338 RepID=UPI000D513037|nr:hypothetical protein [Terrimonas sp.]PVD52690.1 hypothetical protein DC498_09270 [Terrimonas sp.]
MKKTSTKKGMQQKPRPVLKWQTGAYDRDANFKFVLPYQFLLLCRLVDKTPREIIWDFTDNLACASSNREGRDAAKEHLINYFIAHGYGQHHYSEEDIRQIFKEMDAIGMLFPRESNGKMNLIDLYAKWRDKHHTYFFKKWFRKPRRKLSKKEEI